MSLIDKTFRLTAAILVGAYVSIMMMGGGVYWIIYVAGAGAGQDEHVLRGSILIGLTCVGIFVGSVLGLRVWKFRRD